MKGGLAQATLFAVAMLIGLLGVGQLNSQARPIEISRLSATELSTLIETLTARNRELRSGLTDIREQLRQYEVSGPQGESALQVSREDLRRITAFGGLAAVEGQGIQMDVDGNLDAIALNDLINELRNAGAEAIAVDGIRITARSVATEGPRAMELDGVEVGEKFTLRAIGSPDGLLGAMERPGGIISQLKLFIKATIQISQEEAVELPATGLSLIPVVGAPVE
ncbi:MAG TPA: DUF881 domain-containing protein [Candidatus Limnocylindria bacterium]|jgi:uncharacterized protein YlxW (UPF0749 family)|nr:DUF881 domain-containing protein [Candidatus Limnocylindria bacterium]